MTSSRLLQLGTAGLVAASIGCAPENPANFWSVGAQYELSIAVTERPAQLPGLPRQLVDSLRVVLSIDSVNADSMFGRYAEALDPLGVSIGDGTIGPQLVAAHVSSDSFTLVVAPNVIDAQVVMTGALQNGIGTGAWRQLAPDGPSGTFVIRRTERQ